MNPVSFPPGPPPGRPPQWFPLFQPDPLLNSSFWEPENVRSRLRTIQETVDLAKAVQQELEAIVLCNGNLEASDNAQSDASGRMLTKVLEEKGISLKLQETLSLEAANSLLSILKNQIEPFNVLTSQMSSWEEKSAAIRLADKIQKHKRNKRWRKKKRKQIAEKLAKERDRFEQADQEADEWRARQIAKDIAERKVEKMKEISKQKANEERRRLESELELVLIVEKLQELRSIRIQKLKKQGHFFPDEDDKFTERVRAAVEEEERQAAAAADTDAAKDAIAMAEESRRTIQGGGTESKDGHKDGGISNQCPSPNTENRRGSTAAAEPRHEQQQLQGQGYSGYYDSVASLPLEFYHYYHGSNTDMGTLIEVRRTWDAYLRPGGSRIPGHWVQPPPPANEIWASYLVGSSPNEAS